MTVFMPREGVGVTLGAQVGHVVTYRGLPEGGPKLHRFHQKVSKTVKKGGYPLFLTRFREDCGYPPPPDTSRMAKST